MSLNIEALSRYQIHTFFEENVSVTQLQCNAAAKQMAGQSVTPTASQGGTSHTVEGGGLVVQFRVPSSPLDMDLLQSIEKAYRGFVPQHEYRGKLGQLNVYVMNNMGGSCMYLARTELQSNSYHLLYSTIDDYARLAILFEPEKKRINVASADSSPRRIMSEFLFEAGRSPKALEVRVEQ